MVMNQYNKKKNILTFAFEHIKKIYIKHNKLNKRSEFVNEFMFILLIEYYLNNNYE